jgi:hypothetical protein
MWRGVWDWIVKYGPAIAVLAGATWTASTWYFERQEKTAAERRLAVRESQKPFLERQLAFYFEAAKVTAKLATLPPVPTGEDFAKHKALEDWAWARRRFWELYWGELGVVESPEVASAMVDFGKALGDVEKCADAGGDCIGKQKALEGHSISLSHKIRASVEQGWGYTLSPRPTPPGN